MLITSRAYLYVLTSWKLLKKFLVYSHLKLFNFNFLQKIKINFKPIIGDFSDLELILFLKQLTILNQQSNFLNGTDDLLINSFNDQCLNYDLRTNYILNSYQFKKYNLCILLNLNLRLENPLLNAKLRQEYLWNNLLIYSFGSKYNLTYKYFQIGNSVNSFIKFIEGRSWFSNLFKRKIYNPLILFSSNLLQRIDNFYFSNLLNFLKVLNQIYK